MPRSQKSPEDREYLTKWAKDLVAAIGKRQAQTVLDDYRAILKDRKTTKYGKEEAAARVSAIETALRKK